jgi:hypothetical protein
MGFDERFKKDFCKWATKNGRGKVHRGNVFGGKKGIACKSCSNDNEIKITGSIVKFSDGKKFSYDNAYILDDDLVFRVNKDTIFINGDDFF